MYYVTLRMVCVIYGTAQLQLHFYTRLHACHHVWFAWKVPKVTVESFVSTSQAVAFPREDSWHFTTRGISTKQVVEFPRDQLPWNLAWNFHETSSRGA